MKNSWDDLPPEPTLTLLTMFQIDLDNYDNVEMGLMYHLQSLTPSEIQNWPYYEFEKRVEKLNDILKKKNEAEKNANKSGQEQTQTYTNPQKSADSFLKKAQNSVPKMPNMNNIKLPKF